MILENRRFFEVVEVLKKERRLSDYVELAKILNTNKSGINDLKQERKKVSLEILRMMKKSFPDVSLDWLIIGEGNMFMIGGGVNALRDENRQMPRQSLELVDKLISQAKEIGRLENELKTLQDKLEKGNIDADNLNKEDARGAGFAAVGL